MLATGAETRHRARTARLAHTFPQVADEMVSGRLGVGQARELARVYANPRVGDRLGEVIDPFITVATVEDYDQFVQRVRVWTGSRWAAASGLLG